MTALDLNHSSTKRAVFSRTITDRIDAVAPLSVRADILYATILDIERNPPAPTERPGRSVSASAVGDECARRVQLGIWPTFHPDAPVPKQEPIDAKLAAIFERGHRTETLMAEWIRAAGYRLSTHVKDRDTGEERQLGFVTAGGQIKGYADGVWHGMVGSYVPENCDALWENKTISAKNFRAVMRHGVLKQYPKYDAQVQMLLAYLGFTGALVTFLNAETGEIYVEGVSFDHKRAQAVSDRAVHILRATRAGELLPRAGISGDAFPCKWCRFVEECWP